MILPENWNREAASLAFLFLWRMSKHIIADKRTITPTVAPITGGPFFDFEPVTVPEEDSRNINFFSLETTYASPKFVGCNNWEEISFCYICSYLEIYIVFLWKNRIQIQVEH